VVIVGSGYCGEHNNREKAFLVAVPVTLPVCIKEKKASLKK
jgi:hypothetical protein